MPNNSLKGIDAHSVLRMIRLSYGYNRQTASNKADTDLTRDISVRVLGLTEGHNIS